MVTLFCDVALYTIRQEVLGRIYRLISSHILNVFLYNLLNVLEQIANKMGLQILYIYIYIYIYMYKLNIQYITRRRHRIQ
jgi:hypothetical protein